MELYMRSSDQTLGSVIENIQYPVVGMSCMGCVAKVKSALTSVEGVEDATVSLAEHSATVRFNSQKANPGQLQRAVHSVGYELVITGGQI
jgi:copper chaperone CopZ